MGARGRILRTVVLVAAALTLVAPTPEPGPPCPSPAPLRPEARHPSGLVLRTPFPRCYGAPPYEPLVIAYQNARMLAESHPNDFGYPWDDRAKRELVISVTGPTGESLARAWMASGATYTPPGNIAKSTFLAPPNVPVRFRTVTRSFAQLAKLQDDVIDALRAGLLPEPSVISFGPDDEHNRIVMDVQHLSDAFANALVARFGADAIAIRVDPNFGPFTNISRAIDTGPVDPVLIGILLVASLLGVALVVQVMKRRATPL